MVHNIPRAMFVFLPLLALSMKPLYWRPKRYYVEHLLFLIHNHAFVFLVLALTALLDMIPVVARPPGAARICRVGLHGLVPVSRHAQLYGQGCVAHVREVPGDRLRPIFSRR